MAKCAPTAILINLHLWASVKYLTPEVSLRVYYRVMAQNVRYVVLLIALGTIAWLVAGVVAVAMSADAKVIWTCVMGAGLGLTGIRYTIRRARRSGI
jgi:hypothetical protein